MNNHFSTSRRESKAIRWLHNSCRPGLVMAAAAILGLSQPQTAQADCTPPAADLVAWWRGENNAQDTSGAHHGTPQGGAGFTPAKVGSGFSFDGLDDYLSVPDSTAWDFGSGDFTIEFWTRLDELKQSMFIHQEAGGAAGGFEFDYQVPGNLVFTRNDAAAAISRPWSPTAGVWYHLAVVRSQNVFRLYVNGQLLGEEPPNASPLADVSGPLRIGNYADNTTPGQFAVHGLMDEIAIYRRALTASQIADIYNAGAAGKCVPSANLLVNGSFELPVISQPNPWEYRTGGTVAPWVINTTLRGVVQFNSGYKPVSEGHQAVQIETTGDTISQSFPTTPGRQYELGFDLASYDSSGGVMTVTAGGASGTFTANGPTYTRHTLTFTAGSSQSTLTFANSGVAQVSYPHLDNVSVTEANPLSACPPDNAASWWRFDGNLNDSLGANHGTPFGGVSYISSLNGQATSFNGTDGYAAIPYSDTLMPGVNSYTLEGWFRTTANGTIFSFNECSDGGNCYSAAINVGMAGSKLQGYLRSSETSQAGDPYSGQTLQGSRIATDGQWHHFALVRDVAAQANLLYLDGAQETSAAADPGTLRRINTMSEHPARVLIGAHFGTGTSTPSDFFNGAIENLVVYHRALSPAEVNVRHQSGLTGNCNPPALPTINCPPNITQQTTDPAGTAVTYAAPTATSPNGSVTVVCTPASGSMFPVGTTAVNCTATDAANQTATCSFAVTVNYSPLGTPTIACPGDIVQRTTEPTGKAVTFAAPTASSPNGSVTVVCTPASGSLFPVGTTTVNCTATDAANQTATCSFAITVSYSAEFTCPPTAAIAWYRAEGDALDSIGSNDGLWGGLRGPQFGVGHDGGQAFSTASLIDPLDPNDPESWVGIPAFDPLKALDFTGSSFTWEIWARPSTVAGAPILIDQGGDFSTEPGYPSRGIRLRLYQDSPSSSFASIRGFIDSPNASVTSVPGAVQAGQWNHIVFVLDHANNQARLYANGVLVGSAVENRTPAMPLIFPDMLWVAIGGPAVGIRNAGFNGLLDDVVFYKRALTEAEVLARYQCTGTPPAPTISCPPNLWEQATDPAGQPITFATPAASSPNGAVTVVCTPAPGSVFPVGATTVNCTATDPANRTASCSFAVTVRHLPDPSYVYFNDFETESGPEWSSPGRIRGSLEMTWSGPHLANDSLTLTLNNLTPGTAYTLEFDLYVMDSWDGNDPAWGPDYFNASIDGTRRFHETFSNSNGEPPAAPQTYAGTPDGGRRHIGFNSQFVDAIYRRIQIPLVAAGTTAVIVFSGENLQPGGDETWCIDNVGVRRTLTLSPAVATAGPGGSLSFTASGGSGGYTFSLSQNNSGGTINATTGEYLAGTHCGVTDTIRVTDANNRATEATVTIADTLAPVITVCAPARTLSAGPSCRAELPDLTAEATATDACGTPAVTQVPPAGTLLAPGPHTVTLRATDAHGNTAHCVTTVTVRDTTPPIISTCPTAPVSLTAGDNCFASLPDFTTQIVAADSCGPVDISQSPPAGTLLAPLEHTLPIAVVARDAAGNTAFCQVNVSVVKPPPTIVNCPPSQTLVADGANGALLPDLARLGFAMDYCLPLGTPSILPLTQDPAPGTRLSSLGIHTVTFSARTEDGRTATCSTQVKVQRPSFSISGHVGRSGVGVPNTIVRLIYVRSSRATTRETRTDATGRFDFTGVPAGVSGICYPSSPNFRFVPNYRRFTRLSSDLTSDFTAYPVNGASPLAGALAPAAAADPTPGELPAVAGLLLDTNGLPISAAQVLLTGDRTGATTTSPDGEFVFDGLAIGGNYSVTPGGSDRRFTPASIDIANFTGADFVVFTEQPVVPLPLPTLLFQPDARFDRHWALSWPGEAQEFLLESSPSLSEPDWQTAPEQQLQDTGRVLVPLGSLPDQRFFRLRSP